MILLPKKQQGGTIGKAGRMHVQPTDRSAALNYNPQIREVKTIGSTSLTAGSSKSAAAREKMYSGMLPSDQEYLRNLKASKMQEITDKYAQDGYEGSQENLRDLEEYRGYDANMASKGKHYASMFKQNATTAKSRKAEGSMAAVGGTVLAQDRNGSYGLVSYDELMYQDQTGDMMLQPVSIAEAILLRQSNPNFNSFSEIGEFVDSAIMNTYAPSDLPKTLKAIASQAKSSTIIVNDKGEQMSIENLVKSISSSGGTNVKMKSNREKVSALAQFFGSTIDQSTSNYLNNKAIEAVYSGIANGSIRLSQGQNVGDLVEEYRSDLLANYFYGAVHEDLGLSKSEGSDKTGGPQRKIDVNPMASAFAGAGSDKVKFEVPLKDGKVSSQDYMGTRIPAGNEIFNSNDAYDLPDDTNEWDGRELKQNRELLKAGGNNFKFISIADGTVLKDVIGLEKAVVHPNATYHLSFVPVKANPSGEGGLVPAFDRVANYQEVLNELHDKWASGDIKNEDDIKKELIARGMMDDNVTIKPVLAFDVVLKDTKEIDDRYLMQVSDDEIEDKFDAAVSGYTIDKKIKQTKAFMVVDEPSVYTTINMFGDKHIQKMDQASAKFFASGRYKHSAELSDIATSDNTDIFEKTPKKKEGGKAPSAEEIQKLLFNN